MGETESDGFRDTECGSNVLNQSGHVHTTCPTLHYITPHHTILHYSTPLYTTLYYTTLHSTPHHTIAYHTTPHHATLHDMTLHYFRGVKRSLTDYGVTVWLPMFLTSLAVNILPYLRLHYITPNYTTLHDPTLQYTTLHYSRGVKRSLTDSGIHSVAPDVFNQSGHATLHVITPNYTTLDDKTLHYRRGVKRTLHDTILHYTMRHYTTLLQKRSLTDSVVHSVTVPDVFNQSGHVTVHFITPDYTTLHYTTAEG